MLWGARYFSKYLRIESLHHFCRRAYRHIAHSTLFTAYVTSDDRG